MDLSETTNGKSGQTKVFNQCLKNPLRNLVFRRPYREQIHAPWAL